MKIARRHVTSILCDGSRYDAGGPMASANNFPSEREIQYFTLGKNKMCRLVGQSNTQAGGLKVGQNKTIYRSFFFKIAHIMIKLRLLSPRGIFESKGMLVKTRPFSFEY